MIKKKETNPLVRQFQTYQNLFTGSVSNWDCIPL